MNIIDTKLLTGVVLLAATWPAQAGQFKVVYDMPGVAGMSDGTAQAIAQGQNGSLYSTTQGANGTVFSVTPKGRVVTVNDDITGFPVSGTTLGTDGNLYGTNQNSGTKGLGTVYRLTPSGVLTVLYSFTGYTDGNDPQGALIEATDGKLYGTTVLSQNINGGDPGSVAFAMTLGGALTPLHMFTEAEGANISAGLVQGPDGNFYGVAPYGGANDYGTIFKMTAQGVVTVLHNFTGVDGAQAFEPLLLGNDGDLYGVTTGGANDYGVVFKITPAGSYTILYSFIGNPDGSNPSAPLTLGSDGNFYGTCNSRGPKGGGTLFSITPTGAFTLLHSFDYSDVVGGTFPAAPLQQSTAGAFFGDTQNGGNTQTCNTGGCGVIYKVNLSLSPFARLVTGAGDEGVQIGILGQGFSAASAVSFGGVSATSVKYSEPTFLTVQVPPAALTGPLTVTTGSTTLTSNAIFRVTPTAPSFNPTKGRVGTQVVLTGTGLSQTNSVTFDGISASYAVNSDTEVTATVPPNATTGVIGLTTAGGMTTTKHDFQVN